MRLFSFVFLPALLATSFPNCTTGPSCLTGSYCGDVSMNISVNVSRQGYGYYTDGTVTLTFDPSPSDMMVHVRLNATSISGRARTYGRSEVRVPISGSSMACPYRNPSDLVVTDSAGVVIKTIRFNWDRNGC